MLETHLLSKSVHLRREREALELELSALLFHVKQALTE